MIAARSLVAADSNGKSDPFVKLNIGTQKARCAAQPKTLEPQVLCTYLSVYAFMCVMFLFVVCVSVYRRLCVCICGYVCAHMCHLIRPHFAFYKPPLKRGKGDSHFLKRTTQKRGIATTRFDGIAAVLLLMFSIIYNKLSL